MSRRNRRASNKGAFDRGLFTPCLSGPKNTLTLVQVSSIVRNSCRLLTWRRRCQKKLLPLRNPICPGFCHIVHHYFFETHCSTNSFVRYLFLFSCAVDPSNKKICIKQNPANKTWLHHISSSSSTSTHSVTFQVRRLLRRLSPPVEPAVL